MPHLMAVMGRGTVAGLKGRWQTEQGGVTASGWSMLSE